MLWPLRRLQIEVISVCNYRCPLCRTIERGEVVRRRMSADEFGTIVDLVGPELEWLALYGTRGEPLLHPHLPEIVRRARAATKASIVLSTNASVLTRQLSEQLVGSGLSEIIFAVDGLTQVTYSAYRVGGSLDGVLENVREFCRVRGRSGKPRTIFQFIPMHSNEHELADVERFAAALGVDEVRIKRSSSVAASVAFRPTLTTLMPSTSHESHFMCPVRLDILYIDPNGDCFPCCYAEGEPSMSLGNAFASPIPKIWDSNAAWRLRKGFADQHGIPTFCERTCRGVARREATRIPVGVA